ncbi:MerR family transcriptional regulator [Nocardioides sp. Iso805N]|uniref:MerR family transcriptional regulator n=1 Tax=Nocardioides sp. Iso805N TaxID=1283287 RepID=UPI0003758220|nr:MerR family transcriptional regulator [Nocardioides sp. Iso805N]
MAQTESDTATTASTTRPSEASNEAATGMLTVDELAEATGVSVRNIRYYASLRLLPAPERRGRVAYYGPAHRARLDLTVALQEHGFTLQAIERYLARLPEDVTVEDLAMQRAMITSWTLPDADEVLRDIGRELRRLGLSRDALTAAHELTERHLDALAGDLRVLLEDELLDPWRRTHHSPDEVAVLEEGLPRLRGLVVQSVMISFQNAVNRTIGRSLRKSV